MIERIILAGNSLSDGRFIPSKHPASFVFRDPSGKYFAIDKKAECTGILLLGSAGCGKTNVISQAAAQVLLDKRIDCVSIIFDSKGDYYNHRGFFRPGDCIIGNGREFRENSSIWNIFDDILADGTDPCDYEANAREISTSLFKGRESKTQPFFCDAARDILAYVMIYFIRRSTENPAEWGDRLNNADLAAFLRRATADMFCKMFKAYPDMHFLLNYLGDGTSTQALGVLGQLTTLVNDVFTGVFAMKASAGQESFSIRRAVREKKGRAVFIEYDISRGESLTPIYRVLIDLALKEALSRDASGRSYFFLDELKLLPKVGHLEDALNYGRSKGVCMFAGLQNVSQIYAIYGKDRALSILGGFASLIAMHNCDAESREYVTQRFGPSLYAYSYRNPSDERIDRESSGFAVEDWDQRALELGDAIIGLASQSNPFKFHFEPDPFEERR